MRKLLICLQFLAGCAAPIIEEDDGGEAGMGPDAFVPPPLVEAGQPPPPVQDASVPTQAADAMRPQPPADMGGGRCPPAECAPNTALGVCESCDACGQRQVPDDDDQCPMVNCGGMAQFARQGNICFSLRSRPEGGRCLGPGSCRDPDDLSACGEADRMQELVLEGECRAMEGCQGPTPPRIVPAPNGTPCGEGDMGLCQNGTCDLEIGMACAAFGQTCDVGVHVDGGGGTPYCQVAAEGANCIEVCNAVPGSRCLAGWAAGAGCVLGMEIGCIAASPRLICRCANEE